MQGRRCGVNHFWKERPTMKKQLMAVLALTISLSSAAKAESIFSRIVKDFVGPELCPVEIKHLPDMKVEVLYNRGVELRKKGKFCDAAQYFSEARFQYPDNSEYYKKSWLQLIETYMDQKDFVLGINEANLFLDQRKGAAETEYVHYLIVKAVYTQMKDAGSKLSQEWTQYALDINPMQSQSNPFLRNLSFQSFIKSYPDSQRTAEVQGWLVQARNQYCASFIEIGRYYHSRGEYVAAIMRYSVILQWGAQISHFPEAMYEMIRSQKALAKAILNPKQISDKRLREIMRVKDDEAIDRQILSDETMNEAKKLLDLMQQNLADNAWTKSATELLK